VERLLDWYRVGSSAGAVVALVAANLLPLAGVLWFGWSMWTILAIYWAENGIVGFYNVLKMAALPGIGKLGTIPFFVIHYGMFWLVHGIFVLSLPTFVAFEPTVDRPVVGVEIGNVAFAALALFVSHGLSYGFNFIRGGEYRRTTAAELMFAPYRRVVILHLTILFGAFAVIMFGAQVLPLVILVGLKTAMDLGFHLREHRPTASQAARAT
jgi:hypothetical protein